MGRKGGEELRQSTKSTHMGISEWVFCMRQVPESAGRCYPWSAGQICHHHETQSVRTSSYSHSPNPITYDSETPCTCEGRHWSTFILGVSSSSPHSRRSFQGTHTWRNTWQRLSEVDAHKTMPLSLFPSQRGPCRGGWCWGEARAASCFQLFDSCLRSGCRGIGPIPDHPLYLQCWPAPLQDANSKPLMVSLWKISFPQG